MCLIGWFKRVNEVLASEPETWISYLYGQKFDSLKNLQDSKPRYRGKFLRLALWIYYLLKSARFRSRPIQGKCDYLFFAGTWNQKNALATTVEALKNLDTCVRAIAPKSIVSSEDDVYEVIRQSFLVAIKSLIIAIVRAKSLRCQLREKSRTLVSNRLDNFLNSYNALVYFDTVINRLNPKFIIVSNDHNTMNRALIALARNAGIKTIYMQHASVSNLFPALNVDYAFLDGRSALDTYWECEKNHSSKCSLLENREVYLTGQKKRIHAQMKRAKQEPKKVGLALNSLDSVEGVKRLVELLYENNLRVRLRWHPALSSKEKSLLMSSLSSYEVEFSDPKIESLGCFFSEIFCLVAGNSSIHLEAALAHIPPIYYEMSEQNESDYYGYVKNNLSNYAKNDNGLLDIVKSTQNGKLTVNDEAIQYYSSTFGTESEGKEGELVAKVVTALYKNEIPPINSIKL